MTHRVMVPLVKPMGRVPQVMPGVVALLATPTVRVLLVMLRVLVPLVMPRLRVLQVMLRFTVLLVITMVRVLQVMVLGVDPRVGGRWRFRAWVLAIPGGGPGKRSWPVG